MIDKRIAIIGCGNLGLSIVHGLLANPDIDPASITATRRHTESIKSLHDEGVQVTDDNKAAVKSSDILIIALKPYSILDVLAELKDEFDPKRHIIVSVATGISISSIQEVIGTKISIFRAMPNTATDVNTSITCICSNTRDSESDHLVSSIFDGVGKSIHIDEDLMDAATVLGACGIAYALRFIRAMIQGGIEIGFDAQTASIIATQTAKGAAELLIENKMHPEFEIDKVTTPKGCTIAGLNEMEHNGFSSALIKGILTSFNKIDE